MYNNNTNYFGRSNYGYPYYTSPYAAQNPQAYGNYQALAQQNQQLVQQPVMQQQMPVQSQPMDLPIQDIRFLTSDQIKAFIVQPNTKVMLIDRNNKLAYIEATDNMGNFTKEVYSFMPYDENSTPPTYHEIDTNMFLKKEDISNLVTKTDLDTMFANFSDLKTEIDKLQKQVKIAQIKGE